MAGEPVGIGEEPNLPNGNALLTTYNLAGSKIETPLWINQFATDLNIQIDTAQVRRGLVHRPIRFSERYLTFTTIWNVLDRPKYLKLGERIREHWAFNLNENRPTPMVFKYFGASKAWKGFIENWQTAFALTDVVLSYTFNMRLVITEGKADPASTTATEQNGIPFAPGGTGVFGEGWYTQKYLETEVKKSKTAVTGRKDSSGSDTSGGDTEADEGASSDALARGQDLISQYFTWSVDETSGYFDPITGEFGKTSQKDKGKRSGADGNSNDGN